MRIAAIDPGTTQSAFIVWDKDNGGVRKCVIETNEDVLDRVHCTTYDILAIEMIASYGMAVGREVFETCFWAGRFFQWSMYAHDNRPELVYRKDVKLHFCNTPRAKDTNIRQAILDRFGGKGVAKGLKNAPGPLYCIKSHGWAALAVALYTEDTLNLDSSNKSDKLSSHAGII